MNYSSTLLRTILFPAALLVACSGTSDDDTDVGTRDGGAERDAGVERDAGMAASCPDLGPALSGANNAPIRRGDMASAYDPECGIVYLAFGDKAEPQNCSPAPSDFIDDLHAYDVAAGTWHVITPEAGDAPRPRARSQGVWDAVNNRLLVFGGRWRPGMSGAYTFLNDLWAFDPMTKVWTEVSAQSTASGRPSGRMNFGMVMDEANDVVIIHGGGTTDILSFFPNNQTWIYNIRQDAWLEIPIAGVLPPERLFHSTAYDHRRKRLYIFAGAGADAFTSFGDGNMWYLDMVTFEWHEVDQGPLTPGGTNRPRPRIKGKLVEDPARNRLVLFGGHDDTSLGNNNDLWAFDLATDSWSLLAIGDTEGRTGAVAICEFYGNFATVDLAHPERRESHLFVRTGDDQVAMYGGRTDCGLANDTWTLNLSNDVWDQVTVSPNGMTCVRNGNPNCDDNRARMCD